MRFGVLGRLEIFRADGSPVAIAGPARRQVLAALLARAGSFVSAATLIEDLWGPAPPRSAVSNLRSHVARLRDDLGRNEDVLATEGDGYRLRIGPDDLDARSFESLVAQAAQHADAVAAIGRYDAALALWRDEAYLEFGDAPFAVAERVRLAELRARAQERRTELALDLGQAGELIGELERRVRLQPYRERGWEQLALALYRDGRQADALQACRRARSVLVEDLGVDPGPGLQDVESRILRQDPELLVVATQRPAVADALRGRCPYLGLTGYEEHDAAIFTGRERLTSVLAGQLADHSVVILTGASGVGKSSLVRAGLVPALRAGAVPGSAAWRITVRTPATAVGIGDEGRRPDLYILDQAEELFTAVDSAASERLVADVANYVTYGDGRLLLVLRSDYYGRLGEVRRLAALAERATVLVGPMRADDLRRAVLEPAAAAGLRLEPDLVEAIMEDVAGQPEPLPLLSEAMVRTWTNRSGDLLTLEGYQRSGGVTGALEAAAEECYLRLGDDARIAARHVLVRMAAPSGAGGWVRRPLAISEVAEAGPERLALDALVRSRLVVIADRRVELAHDALLEHWPRLRGWLDERALAADLVEHLGRTANAWRSSGHQPADLYRGARLAAALDWRAAHPEDVSAEESEFLDASERAAQAELATARENAAREARGRRRLRRVAVALGIVLVLAIAGGGLALYERGTAQHQARRAGRAALSADVSRLATLAGSLPPDQRDIALLLGAEGYELQPSDVSAGGLQTALMQTPPGLDRVIRYPSPSTLPHLDRSGRLLAAAGADGTVRVYDLASGRLTHTLTWPTPRQFAVFSGDDRFVAAGGVDGTVAVWELATGRAGAPLRVGDDVVHPVFDPRDDNRLFVVSSHGGLSEWDHSDPAQPHLIRRLEPIAASASIGTGPNITISGDGSFLAVGEARGGQARIWETGTGRVIRSFGGQQIGNFATAGDTLPFGFGTDTLLVDARSGRTEATVRNTDSAAMATMSPDGRRLAVPQVVNDNDVVTVYDLSSARAPATQIPAAGTSTVPLGFRADGTLVTSDATTAAIWTLGKDLGRLGVRLDTAADRAAESGFIGEYPQFLAGIRDVLLNGSLLYDTVTGRRAAPLLGGAADGPTDASPDGRLLVTTSSDGLGIWDVATRTRLATLPGVARSADLPLSALHWSGNGQYVAAVVGGEAPYVWTVSDPRHPSEPRRISVPGGGIVDSAQFSADGRRLDVVSASNSRISAIEIATGRVRWTTNVGAGYLNQWAVAPNGTGIALDTGTPNSGRVTVLDAATGRPRGSITLPSLGGVGYLNGGKWLVVTSDQPDPQAQLYDADTLQPFGVPMPTGDLDQHPVAVDPAGTRFAEAIAYDSREPLFGDPIVWTVDPPVWIQDACAVAGRNLTRAEWHQYLPDRPYRATCPNWPAGS